MISLLLNSTFPYLIPGSTFTQTPQALLLSSSCNTFCYVGILSLKRVLFISLPRLCWYLTFDINLETMRSWGWGGEQVGPEKDKHQHIRYPRQVRLMRKRLFLQSGNVQGNEGEGCQSYQIVHPNIPIPNIRVLLILHLGLIFT